MQSSYSSESPIPDKHYLTSAAQQKRRLLADSPVTRH